MKRQISNINFKLSASSPFSNSNFLKFLTKTPSVHTHTLTLNFFNDKIVDRGSEFLFYKRIKTIFILCSKLRNINLKISHDHFASCVAFPFKHLNLAKSLKYFNCNLEAVYLAHFNTLVNYIVSSQGQGLKQINSFGFQTIDFLEEMNPNNPN